MKFKATYYLIIAFVLVFSVVHKSNAALSWDQSGFDKLTASTTTAFQIDFRGIFSGWSLPGVDFTKNSQQIHQGVSSPSFQGFKLDFNQLVGDFDKNNIFQSIISFFVGIIKLIAGIVVWILEFILVIVRRGLSFIS